MERDEDAVDAPRLISRLSRFTGPDHSLSVCAAELAESSTSPMLLRRPPEADPEPETRLKVDEFALIWFSNSLAFPSNPIKILERASRYAASRSAKVICPRELAPATLLRPPTLLVSDGSASERSASSPATEPG